MKTIDQWVLLGVRKSARAQSSAQNGPGIEFPLCWQGKAVVAFILVGCAMLLLALGAKGPVPADPRYVRLIPILILVGPPRRSCCSSQDASPSTQRVFGSASDGAARITSLGVISLLPSVTAMTALRLFTGSSDLRLSFLLIWWTNCDLIV